MKKVEAQVLLQFIWCNKNKCFSILSLLKESVTIVMIHEAQVVALVLSFQVNDPLPSYMSSFGEKD